MNEKNRADALIKSLPKDTPTTMRHAIKIARMRLDAALAMGSNSTAIISEIEQRVEDAMKLERKKQRLANRTRSTASPLPEPEPTPPEPTPPALTPDKTITAPKELTDWTYIPITTGEQIRIGKPVEFTAEDKTLFALVHDQYLFDANEELERTPLLIDERLIDAGGWAETFDVLDFIKSLGNDYAPFVTNVFLSRFKLLTKYEQTTRKTVDDFRRNRAAVVARWTTGLTLFIQAVETGLTEKPELLAAARARINRLNMAHLFNVKTGRITFRATKWTTEQTAAECKLINIFMADMRGITTATDLGILRELRVKLNLPPAVCENLDAHIAKVARMSAGESVSVRVSKDKLEQDMTQQLATDPFHQLIKAQIKSLPDEIEKNPFALFKWLSDLIAKIDPSNLDQAANYFMTRGLNLADAQALTCELALLPKAVENRLQNALGEKGAIGAVTVAETNNALKQIRHPRLRFALVSFMEQTVAHFANADERSHHINDRLRPTAAYFITADELLEHFTRCLPRQISDARLYVLQSAAQDKVIARRLEAGIQRFDKTSALPCDMGRDLLALLTAEEKNAINALGWFRTMFAVDDKKWSRILQKYMLPEIPAAAEQTRAVFETCRDKIMTANAWAIMTNPRGFPFASEAVFSMGQRANSGKIEILHGLASAGINVAPFCDDIRSDVSRLFFHVNDTSLLPPAVVEAQISDIVTKIIRRRVMPKHWPQWITRRAEILLRADRIILETGRRADRKKILLRLLSAPSHRVLPIIEKFPITK